MVELSREIPKPSLRVTIAGEGVGTVDSLPAGIHCGSDCTMALDATSLIRLHANVGENSTFEGWQGPCGSQQYEIFSWADELLFPFGLVGEQHADPSFHEFLVNASERPLSQAPLDCEVSVASSVEVVATFGEQPEEVEVAMLDALPEEELPEELEVTLPKEKLQPDQLLDLEELELPEEEKEEKPPEPEPEKKPEELAAALPPPPPPPMEAPRSMLAVEVPDENEVEEAPDDAQFLSDKNRDVEVETRATETNLEKASNGERIASEESDVQSEDIGGEEKRIAETSELEATADSADRKNEEALGSDSGRLVNVHSGDNGEEGEEGEEGDDTPSKAPGLLSMRNISGRGALGSSGEPKKERDAKKGSGGDRGKRGRRGNRGPKLQFRQDDYERLVGKEVADNEVAVTERKISRRRGRWERKQGMLKSALENFTPEVRPGNQTALKTRAAPFAVYIARMHRGIHKRWGYNFLEGLSDKSASNPMNDMSLWTMLEIVVNPDGTIDKMTIVRNSGLLTFDVAALSVVDEAAPYERTPKKIRSPDGKVYMHWSFHRGPRQCGTFNARPFILSSAPGKRGLDDSKMLRNSRRKKKK